MYVVLRSRVDNLEWWKLVASALSVWCWCDAVRRGSEVDGIFE
jgi:hypothetical protein